MSCKEADCVCSVREMKRLIGGYFQCRACHSIYRVTKDGIERLVSGMTCDMKVGCTGKMVSYPEGTDQGVKCTVCGSSITFYEPEKSAAAPSKVNKDFLDDEATKRLEFLSKKLAEKMMEILKEVLAGYVKP
jgi:hypothetical protein